MKLRDFAAMYTDLSTGTLRMIENAEDENIHVEGMFSPVAPELVINKEKKTIKFYKACNSKNAGFVRVTQWKNGSQTEISLNFLFITPFIEKMTIKELSE